MTETLSPLSSDQIRKEMLSLVKSVKGQVLNAEKLYIEVDWRKPAVKQKSHQAAANDHDGQLDALAREALSCQQCSLSGKAGVFCSKNAFTDGNPDYRAARPFSHV
ncbi:MAG: hypothetical protein CVU51_13445 [Deltaproteobacteria bacterium HGW-Deltaproteobacteria-1]|nr:MAG: hypothetical protein CVU51_13445 [Deltaproteobacteria bacterium HGW-Deltaproteobacteria-1]